MKSPVFMLLMSVLFASAQNVAEAAVPVADEVIVLERYNITSPFWTETEHVEKTALGRVLVDTRDADAPILPERGFEEIYESGPARLRPQYASLNDWLKVVTRPYFTLVRAKETDEFYFALFFAGRGRIACCFYEKEPGAEKFYFVCAADGKGNLLTDYAGQLFLGRDYAADRAGVYFVDANKKPVMTNQDYGLRFIEGIMLPVKSSTTGEMVVTLKATSVSKFERDRKRTGQADALLNMPAVFAVRLTPKK